MRKFLPFVFLLVGVFVLIGGFLVMKNSKPKEEKMGNIQEEIVGEIPFSSRPFVSLTPKSDGHWLVLHISNIKVSDAATLDYELLYKTKTGNTQGVPGSITLSSGQSTIDRELLLGSESSGKFRYDDGVEQGSLTIRFRNSKGKLVGKLSTDFHLQNAPASVVSQDGKFSFNFSKKPTKGFLVTMQTFGLETEVQQTPKAGPYGIFSSDKITNTGSVDMEGNLYKVEGKNVSSFSKEAPQSLGVFFSS